MTRLELRDTLRSKVREVPSWLLYWTGHALSVPMHLWPFAFLYRPYNWLMLLSVSVQGDSEGGPWGKATKSEGRCEADP